MPIHMPAPHNARSNLIYLDHAATTPVDPEVFEKMKPYFLETYGNPSSIYTFAQKARQAIDEARETVANILHVHPKEIIFTGSGTESNNLAMLGFAEGYQKYGRHIIASKIEHDSILEPLKYLQEKGFEVTLVDVGEDGIVDPKDIQKALRKDTILVSVMHANNEIGTIQPIAEISEIIKKFREENKTSYPIFHTDACQSAGYLDISISHLGVDSLTLNAGKIYGPKGVGVLYVRKGLHLVPQIRGGGQEYRIRAGTENVAGIVGLASALKIVQAEKEEIHKKLIPLRDMLIDGIREKIPNTKLNGDRMRRLPNNVNISFRGLEGEAILLRLDMIDIAASAGSACTSGSLEPSHVIQALGLSPEWTHSALRLTLGKHNTKKEVDFLLSHLPKIIEELREVSPFS